MKPIIPDMDTWALTNYGGFPEMTEGSAASQLGSCWVMGAKGQIHALFETDQTIFPNGADCSICTEWHCKASCNIGG